MSFDLLPKFLSVITGPGERQLNEPGFNAVDNCGPAAGSVLMQVLGYPDIEPQAWTDYEYWPTYRGGETYQALNDFIASHYRNPPPMSIESPPDELAAIDGWGKAGLLTIGLFWATSVAQYQPYRTGIGHFGLILSYDGANVTVWNPEWGVQTLSVALFKGASQHLFDVCHRSLSPIGATTASEVIVPQEDLMYLFRSSEKGSDGNPLVFKIEAGHKRHLAGPEYALYVKAEAKIVDVTAAELAPIPDAVPSSHVGTVTGTLTIA